MPRIHRLLTLVPAVLFVGAVNAQALGPSEERDYLVTVTNVTAGLTFTPTFVVLHDDSISLFTPGEAASEQMEALAEAGDTVPLTELGESLEQVSAAVTGDGPVGPGESAEITISGSSDTEVVTVTAMLLPTNDGFYAASNVALPEEGEVITVVSPGYDAGTEVNDELCVSIPGPDCGGAGLSAEDGEGYVHVHRGTQGIADLDPAQYDWRNPVALITVRRAATSGEEEGY